MTGNDACWQTDKVDLSKNWKTLIWIYLCRKPGRLYYKKSNKIIFYLCFCQHDAFSVDIDIFYPSLGVDRLGSVFLESGLFFHPEICKRLKSADYIRWVKMSRRGSRRLRPSVGGRPVMSAVQKILCSSILIQTLCVKGRQVLGLFAHCGGFDSKAASQRQGICHLHLEIALCVKPQQNTLAEKRWWRVKNQRRRKRNWVVPCQSTTLTWRTSQCSRTSFPFHRKPRTSWNRLAREDP